VLYTYIRLENIIADDNRVKKLTYFSVSHNTFKWDTTKPGLWTLDWTMDWTLDSIMDSIVSGSGVKGYSAAKL